MPSTTALVNANNTMAFPLAYINQITEWKALELGRMDVVCPKCNAYHWIAERTSSSSRVSPNFELCCKKGDVQLEQLLEPPEVLKQLLQDDNQQGKHLRKNIGAYNSALSFTSLKYIPDPQARQLGHGPQTF